MRLGEVALLDGIPDPGAPALNALGDLLYTLKARWLCPGYLFICIQFNLH